MNLKISETDESVVEYTYYYDSPLGRIMLASDGAALTGLWFEGQKYFGDTLAENREQKELPIFEQAVQWLDIYFSGKAPGFTPPLSIKTTPFRKAVCEIMLTIPFGETMTYGEIAEKIAKQKGISKMSARAVGGAVGHNPISLMIPCHRVIGTNGHLTGYAGGVLRKEKLLIMEKVMTSDARKDSHTPFIPHTLDIKIAQPVIAKSPLEMEATKACIVRSVAEK